MAYPIGPSIANMTNMDKDRARRKLTEALLNMHLRKAEERAFRDPKTRDLVYRVRKMYRENREGLFAALAATTQEKATEESGRESLPPSRIPQLLRMLSNLAESAPARRRLARTGPLRPILRPAGGARPSRPRGEIRRAAHGAVRDEREKALLREIEQAKKTLAIVKEDEISIRGRRGKYAVPSERLKAERLLRELPGQIAQMEEQLQLIREGIL